MTIQNAPPGLDYDRDRKFSKVLVFFLDRVILTQMCLVYAKTYLLVYCASLMCM